MPTSSSRVTGFLSNVYLPVFLSKNSLAAQSRATKTSLPGL